MLDGLTGDIAAGSPVQPTIRAALAKKQKTPRSSKERQLNSCQTAGGRMAPIERIYFESAAILHMAGREAVRYCRSGQGSELEKEYLFLEMVGLF